MGKREMERIPTRYLVIGMVLILIPFGIYLFFWSMPANQLETKHIQEAEYKVEKVTETPLSGGGLALVSENTTSKALMQIYAKVPVLNRYMFTESYNRGQEGEPKNYIVKVWTGQAELKWEKDNVTPMGKSDYDGWGVGGFILFKLLEWELFFAVFVLIRNDVIKTRKERATNPVKNY